MEFEIVKTDTPDRSLLLLADESEESVADYAGRGTTYAACRSGQILGQYVLLHTRPFTAEVVNIAVAPEYQRRGIATALLQHAVRTARDAGPTARNRHGRHGAGSDRPVRTVRFRPLRHRRRLLPEALPRSDFRKRRRVPPYGAPAHGAEITDHVGRMEPVARMPARSAKAARHCYVYRQDERHDKDSSEVRKTSAFNLPVRRSRDGRFKVPAGEMVYTCFTSDFLVEEADAWRAEAWEMIRTRSDRASSSSPNA